MKDEKFRLNFITNHSELSLRALEATTLQSVDYTGCPTRNVPDFGRALLMLKYTDITQKTYVQI